MEPFLNLHQFKQLKAFFIALDNKSFLGTSVAVTVEGIRVSKTEIVKLLRSFPGLNDEKFKDDNFLIKFLSNTKNRELIKKKLTPAQRIELETEEETVIAEAIEEQSSSQESSEQQATPVDQSTGTPGESIPTGIPSLGSSASNRPSGRIVYNVPHAPEPEKPKIDIANRHGRVAEEPSKVIFTETKGGVVTEHPIGPSSTSLKSAGPEKPQSKLVLANSSGVVKEAGEPSKLVTTNSSGKIIKGSGAETPPSKIFIARSDGTVLREHAIKPMSRFSAFRSKVGGKVTNAARIGLERANPFLKRAGNGLVDSLSSIANPRGVGGTGSRSIFGRVSSRFGKGGGRAASSLGKTVKKRRGLLVLVSMLGFMMMVGMIAISGTPSTGEAAPIGTGGSIGSSDISSCKFTRASNPQPIKSSILVGWINAAAASAGIPPQVLASVAMHENQDFTANADNAHDAIKSNQFCNKGKAFCEKSGQVFHNIPGSDDPCTTDEIAAGAKTAQAVGLMQLIDIYNPGKDLCSITENLNIAAAKLKADGITSQPTQNQVNSAIDSYYNSCTYSSFSYCDEVWQDLQNCQSQVQPGIPTGSVPTEKLAQIVYWTQIINNNLQQGLPATSWNKMIADISNNGYNAHKRYAQTRTGGNENGIYWCTDIIIDSYNLAGVAGLSLNQEAVRGMQSFWQSTTGYNYIPYNQTPSSLANIKPGFIVIRIHPNNYELDHASIVSNIEVDSRGNGVIKTLDSNSFKSWSSPVSDGVITDHTFLSPIVGFGGIIQ